MNAEPQTTQAQRISWPTVGGSSFRMLKEDESTPPPLVRLRIARHRDWTGHRLLVIFPAVCFVPARLESKNRQDPHVRTFLTWLVGMRPGLHFRLRRMLLSTACF